MNKENVITLDNPVKRGEQVIEQVTLMKPNAGTLRGVSLAAVANSEVDALIKVLPRMTAPALMSHWPRFMAISVNRRNRSSVRLAVWRLNSRV